MPPPPLLLLLLVLVVMMMMQFDTLTLQFTAAVSSSFLSSVTVNVFQTPCSVAPTRSCLPAKNWIMS